MMHSFEGLAQRIQGLWFAAKGLRLGRCDNVTAADPEGGSGEVKMTRERVKRPAIRGGIGAGCGTGGR